MANRQRGDGLLHRSDRPWRADVHAAGRVPREQFGDGPHAHAESDAHANANSAPHGHADPDPNAHANPDPNGHADAHGYADDNSDAHSHADTRSIAVSSLTIGANGAAYGFIGPGGARQRESARRP